MKLDDHDDATLDTALRELGDEARVTHNRADLDAVYASVVARLDTSQRTSKPNRVTGRTRDCREAPATLTGLLAGARVLSDGRTVPVVLGLLAGVSRAITGWLLDHLRD